jgi:hypothetical protein
MVFFPGRRFIQQACKGAARAPVFPQILYFLPVVIRKKNCVVVTEEDDPQISYR